ncbi:MAG TPA: PAS domain-containing protein, partial [Bacillota bacterium]|nr:PAS domain-containing protein [Bacillota bacterium]
MDYKFYLDSLLKYLAEGILIVDKDANVVFYNEPVTDLAGISMDEAFGKNILDLFTDLTPETSTFYRV